MREVPRGPVGKNPPCNARESESRSVVSDSVTPWTIQPMEFSSPEYWSNAGGTGSIPGWGTKIPRATTKTLCSQVNKYI